MPDDFSNVPPAASPAPALPIAEPSQDDRTYCMIIHLSMLAGGVLPLLSIVVPIVMWQARKDTSPFVDQQGREAVNFQISILIYAAVSLVLCFILIGFPLLIGVGLFAIICSIIAGITAGKGQPYRYPLCIRML